MSNWTREWRPQYAARERAVDSDKTVFSFLRCVQRWVQENMWDNKKVTSKSERSTRKVYLCNTFLKQTDNLMFNSCDFDFSKWLLFAFYGFYSILYWNVTTTRVLIEIYIYEFQWKYAIREKYYILWIIIFTSWIHESFNNNWFT